MDVIVNSPKNPYLCSKIINKKDMSDRKSRQEILTMYQHVSNHAMPFETTIVDIIPQDGTEFSNRWEFLKGLFFITDDNYFFQYDDVCKGSVNIEQDGQPYDIFLSGALRCAYSYAFCSTVSGTTALLMRILSEGILRIGKDRNNILNFTFVNHGYTYLRDNNSTLNFKNTANNNKELSLKDLIELITKTHNYKEFSKVGDFWCIKKHGEPYKLFDFHSNKYIDITFDKIKYGDYEFDELSGSSTGYYSYLIENQYKWGCLDNDGNLIIDCKYDKIEYMGSDTEEGYIVTSKNKKGLISYKGKIIIPCKYDEINYFTDTRYNEWRDTYLAKAEKKYSIWTPEGECIKDDLDECVYVGQYSEGDESGGYKHIEIFWMKKDGIGIFGTIVKGEFVFENYFPIYFDEYILDSFSFYEGTFKVGKGGKYGIVKANGEIIVNPIYEDIKPIGKDIFIVKNNEKFGILKSNDLIVPFKYDDIVGDAQEKCYIAELNEKRILLDENGDVLIQDYDYDDVRIYKGIGFRVKKNNQWGFIKNDGSSWIPCCYDDIRPYIDNKNVIGFMVCLYNKYGALDVNGNVWIECNHDDLYFIKTTLMNIFVYKENYEYSYHAFTDSEIQLDCSHYLNIVKELERRGFGETICFY